MSLKSSINRRTPEVSKSSRPTGPKLGTPVNTGAKTSGQFDQPLVYTRWQASELWTTSIVVYTTAVPAALATSYTVGLPRPASSTVEVIHPRGLCSTKYRIPPASFAVYSCSPLTSTYDDGWWHNIQNTKYARRELERFCRRFLKGSGSGMDEWTTNNMRTRLPFSMRVAGLRSGSGLVSHGSLCVSSLLRALSSSLDHASRTTNTTFGR